MKAILRGYKNLDFTTEKGDTVKGTKIFYGFTNEGVIGEEVAENFIRDDVLGKMELKIGGFINVEFSNKGKLIRIDRAD